MGVSRVVVSDHVLPAEFATGHVEVRRITMGPDDAAGPHLHNGPVFGVIQRGSVYFQVEDVHDTLLRVGDVFYEPALTRISRFDATSEGVEFLGWFLLPADVTGELTTLAD